MKYSYYGDGDLGAYDDWEYPYPSEEYVDAENKLKELAARYGLVFCIYRDVKLWAATMEGVKAHACNHTASAYSAKRSEACEALIEIVRRWRWRGCIDGLEQYVTLPYCRRRQ